MNMHSLNFTSFLYAKKKKLNFSAYSVAITPRGVASLRKYIQLNSLSPSRDAITRSATCALMRCSRANLACTVEHFYRRLMRKVPRCFTQIHTYPATSI